MHCKKAQRVVGGRKKTEQARSNQSPIGGGKKKRSGTAGKPNEEEN